LALALSWSTCLTNRLAPHFIGATAVAAYTYMALVPMSARVVQRVAQQANPRNLLLMHAMGTDIAGVIGTATAAGIFLGMVG
jgi:Na+-transporting methylmalonyl-CoA/oxaloacetate decarboxylase beta subunit